MEERKNNFRMKNQGNIDFWGTKVMLKLAMNILMVWR
jgi:hypothetical protein